MQKMNAVGSTLPSSISIFDSHTPSVVANIAVVSPMSYVSSQPETPRVAAQEGIDSLLPPPSQLLLSGIVPTQTSQSTLTVNHVPKKSQMQPIFSIAPPKSSLINYGPNGIPILEPVPATFAVNPSRASLRPRPPEQRPTTMINLCDLDMDELIVKVKTQAEFAK